MRHHSDLDRNAYEIVAPPVAVDRPRAASAVPEMPAAAGVLLIAAYVGLLSMFVITIQGARADFAMVIAAFYLAMFFGVPWFFLRMEGQPGRRPSMAEFLDRGVQTATGPISGIGALVQMLIVPVLLMFAILAMGITYLIV